MIKVMRTGTLTLTLTLTLCEFNKQVQIYNK